MNNKKLRQITENRENRCISSKITLLNLYKFQRKSQFVYLFFFHKSSRHNHNINPFLCPELKVYSKSFEIPIKLNTFSLISHCMVRCCVNFIIRSIFYIIWMTINTIKRKNLKNNIKNYIKYSRMNFRRKVPLYTSLVVYTLF